MILNPFFVCFECLSLFIVVVVNCKWLLKNMSYLFFDSVAL